MAIALVAGSAVSGTNGGGVATHTIACNVGSGSNRGLLVGVWSVGNGLVTDVTYAGVAMTPKDTIKSAGNIETLTIWYLDNPTSGSNNIVVTASANSEIFTMAVAYTFDDAGDHVESTATAYSATTTISTAPTPVATGCWVVSFCGGQRNGTASTGLTAQAGNGTQGAVADSNGTVTAGAAYTNTFTISAGLRQLMGTMVIKPTAGGGGGSTPSRFLMMGVGS